MRHILVPVDPTQPARTQAAIDSVIRLHREEPAEVRLLCVQPRVSGHVSMFFDADALHALQEASGAEDLRAAEAQLQAAGVPYASTVRVGRGAPTIVEAARDFGIDHIVFGPEPQSLADRVFGSLAHQVRQLLGGGGAGPLVIGS